MDPPASGERSVLQADAEHTFGTIEATSVIHTKMSPRFQSSKDTMDTDARFSLNGPAGNKIGTWMLVGLTYYSVSGGPLGLEVAVASGGPALAILGFLVAPIVWGASEAAMTAELSIAFPEAAGYSAWTNAAFGPFISFQCSMLQYASGVLDNAIYPSMFVTYLAANDGVGPIGAVENAVIVVGSSIVMTWLTWRGLDVNGATCAYLTIIVILPFLAFAILGMPKVDVRNWLLGPPPSDLVDDEAAADDNGISQGSGNDDDPGGGWKHVRWGKLVNCLFWNVSSFDSASSFAGDTKDPATTFPLAMALTVGAMSLTYLLPMAVATGAAPEASYCDGCLVAIADQVVGPWLGVWITFAAAAGCIGQFVAEMASDSFQIMGMADNGQLPKVLSLRSQYGTPTVPIAVAFGGVMLGSMYDFSSILEIENLLYILAALIEICSLIKLRRDNPNIEPAWKIPVSTHVGLVLFFCPSLSFLAAIVYFSSARAFSVLFLVVAASSVVYVGQCVVRQRGWVAYNPTQAGWGVDMDPVWVRAMVDGADRFLARRGAQTKEYEVLSRQEKNGDASSGVENGSGKEQSPDGRTSAPKPAGFLT